MKNEHKKHNLNQCLHKNLYVRLVSCHFCFADQLLPVHLKKVNIARKGIERVGRLSRTAHFSGHDANIRIFLQKCKLKVSYGMLVLFLKYLVLTTYFIVNILLWTSLCKTFFFSKIMPNCWRLGATNVY
jgi:hypothetical protein